MGNKERRKRRLIKKQPASVHDNPQVSLICPRCGSDLISMDAEGFETGDISEDTIVTVRFCWVCGNRWIDWKDFAVFRDEVREAMEG